MNLKFYYAKIVIIAPTKWMTGKDILKSTYKHMKKQL